MSVDHSGQALDEQTIVNEARSVSKTTLVSCDKVDLLTVLDFQLVTQLYNPANAGNPTKIKFIQEQLQILQKGSQAWLIANDLASCDNSDLRFFGALTFTVKINNDWCVASSRNPIGEILLIFLPGRG